ncbi:MAG: hypothetical protein HQK83_18665 [Fibrobacteria bacterium]|nr:hypothetical protein [Fibrobacteria bacterium]
MATIIATTTCFALCMFGLSVGMIFFGKRLKKSCCGGGACVKKEMEVCPGAERNGELIKTATYGSPLQHHH